MTMLFLRKGTSYTPSNSEDTEQIQQVPARTFSVKRNNHGILYLSLVERDFVKPPVLYGNIQSRVDRIMNTFENRVASTGVLLQGEKGSGKTLLANLICETAQAQGLPVIVINEPYCDEEFKELIQSVSQPKVILFDEFEKVYRSSSDDEERSLPQQKLLTLLDGTFFSKSLFLFTVNDGSRLDRNLINRPGRIYYNLRFSGLDTDFVVDYCNANLKNEGHLDQVLRITQLDNTFNFDMLQSLVEEMNRYDESPLEVLKWLNIIPVMDSQFDAVITKNGETFKGFVLFSGSPFTQIDLPVRIFKDPDDDDGQILHLTQEHYVGRGKFRNSLDYLCNGYLVTFTPAKEKFEFSDILNPESLKKFKVSPVPKLKVRKSGSYIGG